MSTTPELKPCRFCESSERLEVVKASGHNVNYERWCGHCNDCGARGPRECSREEAIAAWNRRAQPAANEWQDIATAPKDGTWFLAWGPRFHTGENEDLARICRWSPITENWKSVSGSASPGNQPTHWMPLPSAPKAEQPKGENR